MRKIPEYLDFDLDDMTIVDMTSGETIIGPGHAGPIDGDVVLAICSAYNAMHAERRRGTPPPGPDGSYTSEQMLASRAAGMAREARLMGALAALLATVRLVHHRPEPLDRAIGEAEDTVIDVVNQTAWDVRDDRACD